MVVTVLSLYSGWPHCDLPTASLHEVCVSRNPSTFFDDVWLVHRSTFDLWEEKTT